MLRHIISVSLVMTACASLIPIKANAVTLTVKPVGTLQRNPGDLIEFILELDPNPTDVMGLEILNISPGFDPIELSLFLVDKSKVPPGTQLTTTTTIASFIFNVLQPVKDGNGDVSAIVDYRNEGKTGTAFAVGNSSGDVQPVPEPLTIFGTATALGCGALFKRKFSKKTVS